MCNQSPTMNNSSPRFRRAGLLRLLLAGAILGSLAAPGLAEERRFLVILANPVKTYGDDDPELTNWALVEAQYFDSNLDNNIYSLAEWWDEVSYGAVTVTGQTFGWYSLPWPIEPGEASPADFINLDLDGNYTYGVGEDFREDPMPLPDWCSDGFCNGVAIDYNGVVGGTPISGVGLGRPLDAYPGGLNVDPLTPCHCCPVEGGECVDYQFASAPGVDNDTCVDPTATGEPEFVEVEPCLPENETDPDKCCLPDECAEVCTYEEGVWSCAFGQLMPTECVALGGRVIEYGSPTLCYQACGGTCDDERHTSQSLGKRARLANIPSLPIRDGIYTPGERFRDYIEDGRYTALYEPPADDNDDGDCDFVGADGDEHQNFDGDANAARPDPFEDYLVRWDAFALNGQGDWVPVSEDYIRSNYPLNPYWSLKDEVDWLIEDWFGYGYGPDSCDPENPTPDSDNECIYLKQEMYRVRGLAYFGALGDDSGDSSDAFFLDDRAIAAWTNVDEMAWRTGNGVYDPPERFHDSDPESSTKMQHVPEGGDPWVTASPAPGTYGPLDTVDWLADFWLARYGSTAPAWSKGYTGRNIPRFVEFNPREPNPNFEGDLYGGEHQRRFFGNAGKDDLVIEGLASGNVEPDTSVGFYDGWVEHDDLPSSKYHAFGDQRFGEVTSPYSDDFWGYDRGTHNPNSAGGPDDKIVAAGPWATNIHGDKRLDGGNVMNLEWMTWRTDMPYIDVNQARLYENSCPRPFKDCNTNGIPDECDISCLPPGGPCDIPGCGTSYDGRESAPLNGIPDECDMATFCNAPDTATNGHPLNHCAIECNPLCPEASPEYPCGIAEDCDGNGIPDECELANNDCNTTGILDDCEQFPGIPQECVDAGLDSAGCAAAAGWTPAVSWDDEALDMGGRTTHPYAGPASGIGFDATGDGYPDGYGFRDYNLDGLVDQGEVRPLGSENYVADSIDGTENNGSVSEYPWNRRRLLEDCIEAGDTQIDFDTFRDINTLTKLYGGVASGVREGLVSGIVLFPPAAFNDADDIFPFAPSYYPIHVEDRPANRQSPRFSNGGTVAETPVVGTTAPDAFNSTLWFHDLPAKVDRGGGSSGAGGGGGVRYQIRYSAHEYCHTWEGYPDLYSYDRLEGDPESHPVGEWCIMADGAAQGYPAHPVADLKAVYSGWVDPVDLTTVLTPGVAREITFGNSETSNYETYYYYDDPLANPGGARASTSGGLVLPGSTTSSCPVPGC